MSQSLTFKTVSEKGQRIGVHRRVDYCDAKGRRERKSMWWDPKGIELALLALHNMPAITQAQAEGKRIIALVLEGELKTDKANAALRAAGRADIIAVGTMTGAGSTPCDDALRSLLDCSEVWPWADNDEDGRGHMQRIAQRLVALGAPAPKWIHWPDAPAKGDAADYFATGGTVEGMLALIREHSAGSREDEQRRSKNAGDPPFSDEHLSDKWDGGTLLCDVTAEPIEWLWEGYVPLRKLTIFDGDPGQGKTMIAAADLAARVTAGDTMPDGSPGIASGAGVVIFTAEDDPADTLLPRLIAAGGDPAKVLVITTMQRPDPDSMTGAMMERLPTFADAEFIKRKVEQVNAKLVIFDPFMAYLPIDKSSYSDQHVRAVLAPLARLAQASGAAFMLIRHLNKSEFANALYRGGGSIGIIGAARTALLVVQDPDDENVRIFGRTKSNVYGAVPSWKYRIVANDRDAPVIEWGEQSERSAEDVLNVSGSKRDTTSKLETGCELLREMLAEGPEPEEKLQDAAKAQGISRATLRRAKKALGVQSEKVGIGKNGYWLWSLGDAPKDAHDDEAGAHSPHDEHLSENVGHNGAQAADLSKGAQAGGYEQDSTVDERLSADTLEPPPADVCPECGGAKLWWLGDTLYCDACSAIVANREIAQVPA